MKALILAAGYATRLYPLTREQPKALLAVGDKTILGHIMDKLQELSEIDEIFIVTNDRFQNNFESWLKTYNRKRETSVINDGTTSNDDRLGAIGDIHFVIGNQNLQDDLLVIAGDNLFGFSLQNLISEYRNKNTSIVALYDIKDRSKAANKLGVVAMNNQNQIIGFEEKPSEPKSSLVSTGCYLFTKNSVANIKNYVEETGKTDNPGDFVKWLLQNESVHGFTFSEHWFDIGSFEALEEAYKIYGNKQ